MECGSSSRQSPPLQLSLQLNRPQSTTDDLRSLCTGLQVIHRVAQSSCGLAIGSGPRVPNSGPGGLVCMLVLFQPVTLVFVF